MSKFQRENRYVVVKRKDLRDAYKTPNAPVRHSAGFSGEMPVWMPAPLEKILDEAAANTRNQLGKPPLKCLVIESDWPEYEPTWKAIEARMTGNPLSSPLASIGEEIHANKIAHGWKVTTMDDWKDPHEIGAVLMLIVTEVAEAMEANREDDIEHFKEEMADIFIRSIGLCHGLGFDPMEYILKKMEKNRTREYKHGGKRI
jgi:NTP pyrophosphatase (non-canonical NTP hydrolase)